MTRMEALRLALQDAQTQLECRNSWLRAMMETIWAKGRGWGGGLNLRMRAELPQSILLIYPAP